MTDITRRNLLKAAGAVAATAAIPLIPRLAPQAWVPAMDPTIRTEHEWLADDEFDLEAAIVRAPGESDAELRRRMFGPYGFTRQDIFDIDPSLFVIGSTAKPWLLEIGMVGGGSVPDDVKKKIEAIRPIAYEVRYA